MIFEWIIEFWKFRELAIAIMLREIKIRYKQTILGILWAILQPALLTLIFTIIFSVILKTQSTGIPYPIFIYSALLPWTFFSTSLTFGSLAVVNNGNLVTKVFFPREILPLASIGAACFDFIMASGIFIVLIFYFEVNINFNLLYTLLIIPTILILTIGISLFLSAVNVVFRDIKFVIPLFLQIWFYLTPIVYSENQIPEKYKFIYYLNPLAPLIEAFRSVTVYSKSPNLNELLIYFVVTILVFTGGYKYFKHKEKIFADII